MPETFNYPSDAELQRGQDAYEATQEIFGPEYDYTKNKNKIFLDTFKEKMKENLEEGFLGQSQQDTRARDIYGDRRRSSGDTVADLGGGNTAISPDTQSLINSQLAAAQMANQPSQGRMAGQPLGGALGAGAGASLLAGAGGIGAASLGTAMGTAALGPLGAIAGGLIGGLF